MEVKSELQDPIFERFFTDIKPIIENNPQSWQISDLARVLNSITTRTIDPEDFRVTLYRNIRLFGQSLKDSDQEVFFSRYDVALAEDHRKAQESAVDPVTSLDRQTAFIPKALDSIKADPDQTIIFLDTDDFGLVNKMHDHETGDAILKALAGTLKEQFRGNALISRWGGEEFVVLVRTQSVFESTLNSSDKGRLADSLEKLQDNYYQRAEEVYIKMGKEENKYGLTFSAGVVHNIFDLNSDLEKQFRAAVSQADLAMKIAKNLGKDRIVQWTEGTEAGLKKLLTQSVPQRNSND